MSLGKVSIAIEAAMASFESDMGRAARIMEKETRKMERDANRLEKEMKRVGKQIGLAIVAGVGIAAAALKNTINNMDELSKAAQRVQMPTEQFSQLAYAGSLADVSIEDLQGALGKLAKAMGDAQRETSVQGKLFRALGIEVLDATGQMRSGYDVLLDFADAFRDGKDSPELMAAGMNIFGRSFQKLIPLLKDGRVGLQEMAAESDRLGLTISTEAGRQAEEFNDNLTRLKGVMAGVTVQVASNLLPSLTDMSGGFVDASQQGDRIKRVADEITTNILEIAGALQELGKFIGVFFRIGDGLQAIQSQADAAGRITNALLTGNTAKLKQASKDYEAATLALDGAIQGKSGGSSAEPFKIGLSLEQKKPFSAIGAPKPSVGGGDRAAAIIAALGDTPKTGGSKKGGGGKSDAQREAEQLLQSYERLAASQAQQIELFGQTTEAARVRYDTENGDLAGLSQSQKDFLIGQAEQLDAMREKNELTEQGKRLIESLLTPMERVNKDVEEAAKLLAAGAISQEAYNRAVEAYRTPAQKMLDDLQYEIELLGKTREQQDLLNAARFLGSEANTANGRAALEAMDAYQRQAKAVDQQIEAMDGLRDAARGFLEDLRAGENIWDSLGRAAQRFADTLFDIAAKRLIEQIFGQFGTTQTGSVGGGFWASLLGAFFGGGKAMGGPVSGNKLYEVGEYGRPELFASGGKTYLIPGNDGMVTPAGGGGGGGGALMPNVEVQINNYGSERVSEPEVTMEAGKLIVKLAVGEVARQAARRGTPVNNAMRAGMAKGGALG